LQKSSKRFSVAFDLEWTYTKHESRGVKNHIIEIGAIKFCGNRVIDRFNSLLSYSGSIDEVVSEITGITDEMLATAPHRQEILLKFYLFIEGATLIAHDIKNDMRVLREEYDRLGLDIENSQIDTLQMVKERFSFDSYKLSSLNSEFQLSGSEEFHRAYSDAYTTYKLYQRLQ
jgi:DNA polymerase III epsilon subunit family exonuclease